MIRILEKAEINRKYITEALQLDQIAYDEVYQLQVDTCVDYYLKNNEIYIMAVDEFSEHVVGYINFSPVSEKTYQLLVTGSVIDTIITSDDVLAYENNTKYYGYFSSIVVHPAYRKKGIASQLLLLWADFVTHLARDRHIYFQKVVADAVSEDGISLLSKIGFRISKCSSHESKIMTLDLFSSDLSYSKYNYSILKEYRKHSETEGE